MSLLATASPWEQPIAKKRTPTIRKSFKKPASTDFERNELSTSRYERFDTMGGGRTTSSTDFASIHEYDDKQQTHVHREHQEKQEQRHNRINTILENMNSLKEDNDGGSLYDYNPTSTNDNGTQPSIYPPLNRQPLSTITHAPERVPSFIFNKPKEEVQVSPLGSLSEAENLTDYRNAYDGRIIYNNGHKESFIGADIDNRILDKIQYLTHMLEEMQDERTANVNEEFVLYTMLGVFIIYLVDGFVRLGKYIK